MTAPQPIRPSLVTTATVAAKGAMHTVLEDVVRIPIGLLCLAGGGWLVAFQAKHPPANTLLTIIGAGFAFLGFCAMPFLFPIVKQVVVIVTPFIPVVGGKRVGDIPKEPTE